MPISIDIHENEFLEEIFQEGREEGLQEGREEGREEQSRQLLRRLLERRFGPLSPEVTGKLRSAQPDLLEQWILRSVDCKTLSEVFE
jgi:predicted transposase YdaD